MTGDRSKKFRIACLFFLFSFVVIIVVSDHNALSSIPKENTKENFCNAVNDKFVQFGWHKLMCNPDRWKTYGYTSKRNPLIYQELGFHDSNNARPVNLLFCGVHGDEPSGIYICFELAQEALFDNPDALNDLKLVIAPIVNPDGFFANTRENANGVDLNRNLPTKDWDRLAQKVWIKYKNDPRKYPGSRSGSEPESRLQAYLIDKYRPDKIISVHAPLGFLDFDGPGDQKYRNLIRIEKRAKYLGLNIEANSKNLLKLVDFRFFPGSLGNFAGNERNIPTYTIELPSSDPSRARDYWTVLRFALLKALRFEVYDKKERNPFFSDDTISRRVAYTEPEPFNAAEHHGETKIVPQGVISVKLSKGSRVLIISGLLVSLVTFQLVMQQRKQPATSSNYPDIETTGPEVPRSALMEHLNSDDSVNLRYLSKKECDELIHACEPHLRSIVISALHTGMKKIELLNLQWDDIDIENGYIILDRTKKTERVIPVSDALKKTLGDIPRRHDVPYVFYNNTTGKPYRNISKSFAKALRKSNIHNFHFRDLRHTFACHLLMDGMDIKQVMKILGVKTTRKYSHLAKSHKG